MNWRDFMALIITLIVILLMSVTWSNSIVNRNRLVTIEELLNHAGDRWTGENHRDFAKKLKELNPGLVMPKE